MSDGRASRDGDSVLTLVRETVDGLGHLVGEHLKLARLELQADVRVYGGRLAVLAGVVGIFVIGYGLACIGLSFMLGRWLGLAGGFFAVAGGHAVLGAIVATIAGRRLREAHPMRQTVNEVSRSVSALAAAGTNGVSGVDHRAVAVRPSNTPAT